MISIVDDDVSVRQATKMLLHSAGYEVGVFDSAEIFLGSGALARTDCLIVDVRMPGMDGLELQRRVRVGSRSVPVIFMSAFDDHLRRRKAVAGGALHFFQKPFDATAMLAAIENALASPEGASPAVFQIPGERVDGSPALIVAVTRLAEDRTRLGEILGGSNCTIAHYESIQEALGSFGRASAVLCDEHLPDGSWKDVWRTLGAMPQAPLFAVTSRLPDDRLWEAVREAGGDDVVTKPFRAEEIRRFLSSNIGDRKIPPATLAHDPGSDDGSSGSRRNLKRRADNASH